jgi:hypothetical protein
MITCDIGFARKFIQDSEYLKARKKADTALEQLQNKTGPGSEWLGWRDLLSDPNDAELEQIVSLAEEIRSKADVFIVCGIGGSYLGSKAVIDALTPHFKNNGPEILYAGHHMGGKYLEELLEYLKAPKADGEPKSIYLNVISKSGSTLETALSFRLIREVLEDMYGEDSSEHIICTTGKEGGLLNKLIDQKGYRKFIIPDDVGGRYSVLTPVGLLPIAVAGIDVRTLLYGAVSAYNEYEDNAEDILEYAALRNAIHESGKTIDVFGTFEPELTSLGVGTAASGTTGEIRATNEITAYYSSDVALKENITTIDNALDIVNSLQGVKFDWKDEYIKSRGGEDGYFVRKHDTGIIAQDIEKVLPEIVAQRADGYKGVKYEKLMGLVIQAIKELSKKMDEK